MRVIRSLAVAIACALPALAPITARAADCPAPPVDLPLTCVATDDGYFYASDHANAQIMAAAAATVAKDFPVYFQRAPLRSAVVETGPTPISGERLDKYQQASGVAFVLPWISAETRNEMRRNSIQNALRQQRPELDETSLEALVTRAMAATPTTPGQSDAPTSALQHELGHKQFMAAFYPEPKPVRTQPRYGSPAPDWIDEVAALLMEDTQMTEKRRGQFQQILRETPDEVRPLSSYFDAIHPVFAAQQEFIKDAGGSGARVLALTGEQARLMGEGSIWFYLQGRAFIDFLHERGTRTDVFASIAEAFVNKQTMAQWLTSNGHEFGLPGSVEALQAEWDAWLQTRLGSD